MLKFEVMKKSGNGLFWLEDQLEKQVIENSGSVATWKMKVMDNFGVADGWQVMEK